MLSLDGIIELLDDASGAAIAAAYALRLHRDYINSPMSKKTHEMRAHIALEASVNRAIEAAA